MFTNLVILTAEFNIVTKVVIDSRNVMDREFQQRFVPKLKNKPKLEPAYVVYSYYYYISRIYFAEIQCNLVNS
jgi:hypothetical protein